MLWKAGKVCKVFVLFLQHFYMSKFISKYNSLTYLNLQRVGIDLVSCLTFSYADNLES